MHVPEWLANYIFIEMTSEETATGACCRYPADEYAANHNGDAVPSAIKNMHVRRLTVRFAEEKCICNNSFR